MEQNRSGYYFSLSICFFIFLLMSNMVFAQKNKDYLQFKGKILDQNLKQLEYATIKVLKTDSVIVSSVLSNHTGDFLTDKLPNNKYILQISFLGHKKRYLTYEVDVNKIDIKDFGALKLEQEDIRLGEVSISADVSPIKIKGDTVEYNASSFYTSPDANLEKLLKKLPGLQVNRSGEVKANGEVITKVTVDGKDFFGNDPKVATKNLPADAIDKVQLIDDKSEQSKNSGIDDGTRKKVVNIVLKKDRNKGWFGNLSAANGTKERYAASLSANHFNQKSQFNVLFGSNNISEGFSSEDARSFNSEAGRSFSSSLDGSSSASVGGINVGGLSGITQTHAGGLNYTDLWGKKDKFKFSSSYINSFNTIETIRNQNKETIQSADNYFTSSQNSGNVTRQSHNLNLKISKNFNELTSFSFSPSVSYLSSDSRDLYSSIQSGSTSGVINNLSSAVNRNNDNLELRGTMMVNRSLNNKKGKISLNFSNENREVYRDNFNVTANVFSNAVAQNFNRKEIDDESGSSYTITGTFTRSISKDNKSSLFLTSEVASRSIDYDRMGLEFDAVNNTYTKYIDSLSSEIDIRNTTFKNTIGWNKISTKVNLSLSLPIQLLALKSELNKTLIREDFSKNYLAYLPEASIIYKPKPGTSWTFRIDGNQNMLNGSDLLINQYNANPLLIVLGNPDLKPTTFYSTSIRYSSSDRKTNRFSNFSLNYNQRFNDVGKQIIFDDSTGIQTIKTINVGRNSNFSFSSGTNIPVSTKNLSLNVGLNANSYNRLSFLNGVKNKLSNYTFGENMEMGYSIKDVFDISLNSTVEYNVLKNTVRKTLLGNYFSFKTDLGVSYEPLKKWVFDVDVFHTAVPKQQVVTLNASIKRYFFDKRTLYVELQGFDILNQNSNVNRYILENTIVDSQSNNIRQFFYLKLNYKLNKLK